MGTWGIGLYSGDFAMDLRGAIRALARLPFDGDRLVQILCQGNPAAANNPNDEEHTRFWLVAADQFAKHGIVCDRLRHKAIEIIDSGSYLAMMEKLGMAPRDVNKQRKLLADLRARFDSAAPPSKPRSILKKAQQFIIEVGDVFVYPTAGGRCINSYASSKDKIPGGWVQDGWGAVIIVERGRAFEFLTWYRPLTIAQARTTKPLFARLEEEPLWVLRRPGTCTPVHFRRLELEKIGEVKIDPDKLANSFPSLPPGTREATDDISLTNSLNIGPHVPADLMPPPGHTPKLIHGRPYRTLTNLGAILA